ncbi:MAG: chemotaxis protein CheB [Gammaproteobacteria bacterium]|nr:MAG: chemotaxis protein CheB [Gammaproteobacteria bacterium]
MDEAPQAVLRVALLAEKYQRNEFRALLESEGMEVVLDDRFDLPLPDVLNGAEVLLVDMSDRPDRYQVQDVLDQSPVPVLLNQGGIGSSTIWQRRLLGKLQSLANRSMLNAGSNTHHIRPELRVVHDQGNGRAEAPWLVVLGASIGGPRAVAQFLQALPNELPVVLLLAQHISESYQDLFAKQLDRCSTWSVAVLGEEQTLAAGQAWVVPSESHIEMAADGIIRRSGGPWESVHRPDINTVLKSAAKTFGKRCGAIMFSGPGQDGSLGCAAIAEHGGFVWTQSPESCVIAGMPEATRRSCRVELSGTPEQLAQTLVTRCQSESASIN